jgi:hypothetical protein
MRQRCIAVAIVKKTGRQFSQWLKVLRERNQPPHKWYAGAPLFPVARPIFLPLALSCCRIRILTLTPSRTLPMALRHFYLHPANLRDAFHFP